MSGLLRFEVGDPDRGGRFPSSLPRGFKSVILSILSGALCFRRRNARLARSRFGLAEASIFLQLVQEVSLSRRDRTAFKLFVIIVVPVEELKMNFAEPLIECAPGSDDLLFLFFHLKNSYPTPRLRSVFQRPDTRRRGAE